MKLSTKVRYGVRALIDIAIHSNGKPVLVESVANRQEISKKYLENLLSSLKVAGIVRSVRGAKGGYLLARKPDDITLEDIVKVFEGELTLVDCLNAPEICNFTKKCPTREVWDELGKLIAKTLRGKSLADLVARSLKLNKK